MQTKPTHQTEQPPHKGASWAHLRRLLALVLTILLGASGLLTSARPVAAMGVSSGATVVTGDRFSCALVNGGVKCWGGLLGNGSSLSSSTPVNVTGLTSGVVAISAGVSHACAVTSGGALKCWGYNYQGQLGDGTTVDKASPVTVSGLSSGIVAVAAGGDHTCAVTSSGGVKCWGSYAPLTPVDVAGLTGVVAITAGNRTTCVLTNVGGVKCWGNNDYGQLGDGTTTSRTTPVDVSGLTSGVVSVSTSSGNQHTCAVTSSGAVKCWGINVSGELGIGAMDALAHPLPLDVSITGQAVRVSAGGQASCAVMADGTAQCWGLSGWGILGIGDSSATALSPMDVVGGGFISIDLGVNHSCAATTTGVRCTGLNDSGQIGNGSPTSDIWYAFGGVSGLGSSAIGTAPTTNLAITKTASVSSATTGTPFNYTVTVTNNGSVTATNVNIKDKLPANVTYNSATPSAGGSCGAPSGGVLTCTWPSIAAGASVNVVINVTP